MALTDNRTLVRHVCAYTASEAAAKISRVAVVLVVARTMPVEAIGLVAAAMAVSDILKALTENGVSLRIIRADEADLEATCRCAHGLFWIWCVGLFLIQVALAGVFYVTGGSGLIAGMIAVLAIEYLFMPAGLVQCALAMREGRMTQTATIAGGQIVGANLATAVLVFVWPDPYAIILPKVLSGAIWLIAMRRLRPWQRPEVPPAPVRPFFRFGAAVLGVEILKAFRLQADKLIIGAVLGAEALGLWFFAVNAGLGLASSFSVALGTVLFPNLCASSDPARTLRHTLLLALCVLAPAVVFQALMAPVYVPLLFGERWAAISGLVSILCLAAIPHLIWTACAQFLRAQDRAALEFGLSLSLAVAALAVTAALSPLGLEVVAWGTVIAAFVLQTSAAGLVLVPISTLRTKEA
ncbi:MAG: oligosaccharide flippase family protein [Pseudomonadota bacterium]